MKKLLLIVFAGCMLGLLVFGIAGCSVRHHRYVVSVKDGDGFDTHYYTNDTTMSNGCVSFVDSARGQMHITVCGSFSIYLNK